MKHNNAWLAASTLGLTAILALAVLALIRTQRDKDSEYLVLALSGW
jgi:hypothetical protein